MVAALASAASSCAPVATQLVVVLRSDVPVQQMRSIDAQVLRQGVATPIVHHMLPTQGLTWPLSFGVVAADANDARPLIVIATLQFADAMGGGTVTQSALVQTVSSRILQLDLYMNRDCVDRAGVPSRCTWPQTCSVGQCVAVERTNLPQLNP
jgi:hypothetical protein